MKNLWKKRIALSIFSTFMCLLILLSLEAGTRVFWPEIGFQDTEKSLQRGKAFGNTWAWVPNASGICFGKRITIDEFGFRKMTGPEKYASSWLILGDSVTFGVGVDTEDTYIQLLQNTLPVVKLWNTAVLGYDFRNYKDVLRYWLVENQSIPNIKKVLLFICLNDVDLNSTADENPRIKPVTSNNIEKVISFFRRNSKFYALMKSAISDRSKVYFQHDYQLYNNESKTFIEAMNIVDEMNTFLNKRNIDFVTVILPYEYQVRTKDDQYLRPQKLLTAYFMEKGIPYIDTYEYFERTGNEQKNFLYADFSHFSKNGHQVVANILKEHFKAE
ncbi:MAG: SGNH/GDSL hydrolase family protein [Acidobacteria bacterium]|nr:SGNH/GDSL hydrolase family protein [Acidobacteriota bacterium]